MLGRTRNTKNLYCCPLCLDLLLVSQQLFHSGPLTAQKSQSSYPSSSVRIETGLPTYFAVKSSCGEGKREGRGNLYVRRRSPQGGQERGELHNKVFVKKVLRSINAADVRCSLPPTHALSTNYYTLKEFFAPARKGKVCFPGDSHS